MSPDATALFLGLALVLFVVATIMLVMSKAFPHALIAAGLSSWMLVLFWNAWDLAAK